MKTNDEKRLKAFDMLFDEVHKEYGKDVCMLVNLTGGKFIIVQCWTNDPYNKEIPSYIQ